jgi:Amt family ammonium transporter
MTADSAWAVGASGKAIPELVFAAFQMSFAAITGALVIGALVERVRFGAIMLFSLLWQAIVYAPLAHMVWAADGFLFKFGAIDFAGGTVVHINSGVAGLVGVAFAGPRIGHLKEAMPPHSLALTMVGAGLLWVGWFGFNAGSALEANGLAAVAMVNTLVAPAAGLLAWMGAERLVSGKPSMLGGASGAVAGLVAITPAAGASGPIGAMLLGAVASLVCYGFVGSIKNRLGLDDSLDVFGIHGLGGIMGSIGTAVVALPLLGGHGGADYNLGWQLVRQLAAVAVAIAWSAAGSALCFAVVRAVMPLRHARDAEREGLDIADHGERAYNY